MSVVGEPGVPPDPTAQVLAHVNRTRGFRYRLNGPAGVGFQSGAHRLLAPDGSTAVLKWSSDRSDDWVHRVLATASLIRSARAVGWPTPAWSAVGTTPDGYPYEVQELAEGTTQEVLTARLARAVLPVLELQRGLRIDTDQDWSRFDASVLAGTGGGYVDTVRRCGAVGSAFLRLAAEAAPSATTAGLPTVDLVHGDLNPSNVLLADGVDGAVDTDGADCVVSALVDAEAAGRGSRFHDVATLLASSWLWGGEEAGQAELVRYSRAADDGAALIPSLAAVLLGLFSFVHDHGPGDAEATIRQGTSCFAEFLAGW